MKGQWIFLGLAVGLLLPSSQVAAIQRIEPVSNDAGSEVHLICLADRPAIVEGQSVTLRAWATTAAGREVNPVPQFQWHVEVGRIDAVTTSARWDLAAVKLDQNEDQRRLTALITASRGSQRLGSCQVEVFVGRDITVPPDRAPAADDLFTAKHFLLPTRSAARGFGLYSYLLFSAPPRDAEETARYLKTIEACLSVMSDVDEYLSRHVPPMNLNVTYIPLVRSVPRVKRTDIWAENVLQVYDYTQASVLLHTVKHDHEAGPYVLSTLGPARADSTVRLWEDFTGVAPELTWDRIRFFTYLAAQERTWSEENLRRLGLNLRNLIAVGGKVLPDVMQAADRAVQFEAESAGEARAPERRGDH